MKLYTYYPLAGEFPRAHRAEPEGRFFFKLGFYRV